MNEVFIAIYSLCGVALFIAGVFTGIWIKEHAHEVVEREVPKIITTEKAVPIEVPKYIPTAPREDGGTAVIGSIVKNESKNAEAEAAKIRSLINQFPEG